MKRRLEKSVKGQIWIETVVYTLIALLILGAVLGFVRPKIEKLQDESIIDDSISMLEDINEVINDIKNVPGNKRQINLGIRKGSLTIDAERDVIIFDLETKSEYIEPGILIKRGSVELSNVKMGELNLINATLDYDGIYNITWKDSDSVEKLTKSSANYKVFVSHAPKNNPSDQTRINFEIV